MFIPKQIYFVNLFIFINVLSTFLPHTLCGLRQSCYILDKLGYALRKRNYYNFILNIYLLNIGYNLNLDHKCSSFGSRRRRASPYTNTERYLLGKRTGVRSKALQIFQFTKLIFEKIYLFRYILNNLYMLIK